jgi:hypothetical protein
MVPFKVATPGPAEQSVVMFVAAVAVPFTPKFVLTATPCVSLVEKPRTSAPTVFAQNVQSDPFVGIVPTADTFSAQGCDTNFEKTEDLKKPTANYDYQVHVFYGPDQPTEGCPMEWLIKFISKYDETEFLNQVQFDVLVVDDNLTPLRSIAQDEGRQFLYSPSGQYILDMIVEEKPGKSNYVIWIYGLAPEGIVPSTKSDYLEIPLQIYSKDGSTATNTMPTIQPKLNEKIPDWIKNNAGWWADGSIDDKSFVQGIQFLIQKEIIVIPPTSQGSSSSNQIPAWIKNNAAFSLATQTSW